MEQPLRIHYHGIESSESLDQRIREKVQHLEHYGQHIISCRVTLELSHHRHHKGNVYTVGLEISLPGERVVVGHHGGDNHAHEDVYVALRDAFATAGRLIVEHARREPVRESRE